MKRISPFRNNRPDGRQVRKPLLFAVFIVVVLAYLWQPLFFSGMLYRVMEPFWLVRNYFADSLSTAADYFTSKTLLARQNESLTNQLRDAQQELLQLGPLHAALQSLEPLSSQAGRSHSVIAAVLSRPPLSPYDSLVLDAGSRAGVAPGDLVRTTGGIVIGKITESFSSFSRTVLFSSPGQQTPVLLGKTAVQANALGVGAGEFQVLLPREVNITVGDTAVFPGFEPHIVGIVNSVEYRETDFLQLVSFQSPVNIFGLRYVQIDMSSASGTPR